MKQCAQPYRLASSEQELHPSYHAPYLRTSASQQMALLPFVLLVSFLLLVLSILSACTVGTLGPQAQATTAPSTNFTLPPATLHRDKVTIQYCGDVTGSYPPRYFAAANAYLAQSMQAAITADQDGVVLYPSLITAQPENPVNSLEPIVIPATFNWPVPPTIAPTPTAGTNPWQTSQARASVQAANANALRAYQTGVQQIQAQLVAIRQQVQPQLDRLQHWSPARNAANTSIFGCLGLASQRLSSMSGTKLLVIASDLQENSWADFTRRQNLRGIRVEVIDLVCTSVPACDAIKGQWGSVFRDAGATSWSFADPAQTETLPPLLGGSWPTPTARLAASSTIALKTFTTPTGAGSTGGVGGGRA